MAEGGDAYEKRLSEIRKMPHGKEAAKDFRIETYYSNADLALKLVRMLTLDSDIPTSLLRDEVSDNLENTNNLITSNRLIKHMARERELVNFFSSDILRALKVDEKQIANSESTRKNVGSTLFRSIVHGPQKGDVEYEKYPFAIALRCKNREDIKSLSGDGEYLGGCYIKSQRINVNNRDITIPVIVAGVGPSGDYVIVHEHGHAVNKLVMWALEDPSLDRRIYHPPNQEPSNFVNRWGGKSSVELPDTPISNTVDFEHFLEDEVVPYAFSEGKNELLTDLVARGNFMHFNAVTDKNYYDYITDKIELLKDKHLLNLSPDDYLPISTKVWDKYVEEITIASRVAARYFEQTVDLAERYGLDKKRDLAPYVLAQIPIGEWKTVLVDFKVEIEGIRNSLRELDSEINLLETQIYEGDQIVTSELQKMKGKRELLLAERMKTITAMKEDGECKSFNNESKRISDFVHKVTIE